MLGTFLQPDPFNYFFGNGIGTNIGASIVWGFLAGLLGVFVARKVKAAWARLHAKLDAHHDELHEKLDRQGRSLKHLHERHDEHADSLIEAHRKLDALLAAKGSGRAVE